MTTVTRILVVDDDPSTVQLLSYMLRRAGYDLITADDGEQGLRSVERYLPHLIVCDVHMPVMDGLEMCRRVRGRPGFELVPFVFLSARSQIADRVEGLETGADDYIAKPFDRDELLARIDAVLRRSQAYQRAAGIDALTELGNRERFEDRLQEELYREQRYGIASTLTLVAIDVDELDEVARAHGTAASDAVIRHVGRFLRYNVRALDVPTRYNTSGFIVLMPHTSRDRAMIAIERLSARLNASRVDYDEQDLPVNASFGVAIVDGEIASLHEMLGRAHAAMMMARRHDNQRIHVWTPEDGLPGYPNGDDDGEGSDR